MIVKSMNSLVLMVYRGGVRVFIATVPRQEIALEENRCVLQQFNDL